MKEGGREGGREEREEMKEGGREGGRREREEMKEGGREEGRRERKREGGRKGGERGNERGREGRLCSEYNSPMITVLVFSPAICMKSKLLSLRYLSLNSLNSLPLNLHISFLSKLSHSDSPFSSSSSSSTFSSSLPVSSTYDNHHKSIQQTKQPLTFKSHAIHSHMTNLS